MIKFRFNSWCWVLLLLLAVAGGSGVTVAGNLVAQGEYFVETDPGVGNGVPLVADDTVFDADIEDATQGSVDVSGLAAGWHRVGMRFRDNNGTWGSVRWQNVCVFDGADNAGGAEVQPAEYFVDDDPGAGKAYPLLLSAEQTWTDIQDAVPVTVNTGKLVPGVHHVGVRFRNAAGVWGTTRLFTFFVFEDSTPVVPAVADIAETEDFWGEPPMVGGGQPATLVPVRPLPGLADGQNLAVSTAVQEIGVRQLGIRFKGTDGQWSAARVWPVRIDQEDVAFTKVPLHVESNLGIPLYNLDSWWKIGDTVALKVPPVITYNGVQYHCLGWIGTGNAPAHGAACTVSFTITKASTLTWIWSDKAAYTLSVSNDRGRGTGGGAHVRESTVTATVPGYVYESETVRWRAAGYTGTGSVPATGGGVTVTFAIHGDSTISWNWVKQYRVDTPAVNGHVDGNDLWYDTGTATSLTPIADPDYAFDCWEGDGSGTAVPGVFTISSAKRIIARFKPSVKVTLRATQIDGSEVVTSYTKGSVVTATPTITNVTVGDRRDVVGGWRLESAIITPAATGDGARIALEMKEDVELTWVPLRQYRVVPVVLPAAGGTVRLSGRQSTGETEWYDQGPLDGTASAAAGYRFVGWYLQDQAELEFRTLLASELKIVALFQKVQPLAGFVDVTGGALTSPNTGVFSFTPYIPTAKLAKTEVTTAQYAAFLNAALALNIIQSPNSISVRGQNPLAVYQAGLNVEWFSGDAWVAEAVFLNRVTGLNFDFALGSPADAKVGTPPCTMTDIDNFSVRFRGEIEVSAAGTVRFRETSADEMTVVIDGQMIIQDTTNSVSAIGSKVLTAGWHTIEVIYIARTGYALMKLEWDPAGGTSYVDIPAARLRSKAMPSGWENVAETCGVHTYYPEQELLDLDAPDCNLELVNGQYQPKTGLETHPVVEVSWYGAKAYCRWLAEATGQPVDLPDEWLWEYAASGGDSTLAGNYYPWGPKFAGATHDKANYLGTGGIDTYNGTAPVGLFPTYLGLQDMAGNAWEWTNSHLTEGSVYRVLRGGSWNQPDSYMATSGRQVYKDENYGDKTIGFRPAVVYQAKPFRATGYVPVAVTPAMTSVNRAYPGYVAPTQAYLIKGAEVTNAEYAEFLNWAADQGYVALSGDEVRGCGTDWHDGRLFYRLGAEAGIEYISGVYATKPGMEWLPAAFVTWYGADAWCRWQNAIYPDMRFRLPDEWEWENAMTRGDAEPERYAVYSADFEAGSGTEWSAARTDNIYPADLTAYSGKFNKETQTLTLALIRGHYYTVQFDLYLIDGWRTSDRMQVDVNGWRTWDVAPLADLAATETRNAGYNAANDLIYRKQKITFYAATDTTTLAFHDSGDLQAASVQSWGLDNVYVYPDRRRLTTGEPAPDASNYLRTEQGLLPVGRMGLEVFYDWSFSPGIYDASGNVQEWTSSLPAPGMTELAALRGGAWNMHELQLPFTHRGDYADKDESTEFMGFRPVIEEMAPRFERQQEDVVLAAGGAAARISLTARALNPGAAVWAWQLTQAPTWVMLSDKTGGHAELTVTPPASPETASVSVLVSDGILTSVMSFSIQAVVDGLELREMPDSITLSQNCPLREFFIAAKKVGGTSGTITWAVDGSPAWATIAAVDSEWAKLTVSATAAREADIVIRAQAGAISATRTVHVSVRNEAPEILDAPQTVIMERNKDYVDVPLRGRDDDGCQSLSWSIVGSPAWVSILWSAQSEAVIRIQRQGSVMNASVVVRLSDGIASVDRTIQVQDANTAPELVAAPSTLTAALGDPVQNTLITATDPDVEQTLTWSLSPSVSWLTVTANTARSAVLMLSPTVGVAGQVFTLTMSDGVTQVQRTITVTVASQAPVITGDIGSQDFEVGSGIHYLHYTVSDPDVMQALTLRITNIAGWFTWYPVSARQIEVAVDTSQAVSGTLELSASDGNRSATASIPVRVTKLVHAPVISGMPSDLTMPQYAQAQVYHLQATDANPANAITWGLLYRVPNVELIPGAEGEAMLVINPLAQLSPVSVGVQASDGRTTTTEFFSLEVTGPSIDVFKIVAAEYFLDTEPVAGSGTPILSTDDRVFSDLNDYETTLRLPADLADGAHRLGIRFKRQDGIWGATRWTDFYSFTDGEGLEDPEPVVSGGEFFVDTDPGIGLALPLPLDAAQFDTEVEDVAVSFDSSALLPGVHAVGLRMKRADGTWSATRFTTFYVFIDQTPEPPPATGIVSAEYYWDDRADAGFGFPLPLATPPPGHTDAHSVDTNQILTSHIPPGTHYLGVRFQDAGGEWGSAIIAQVTMEQETSPLTLKNLHIESNLGLAAMNYDSQHQAGSVIHLRVPYRYFDGTSWWSCQGWVGTGDVPPAGEGTDFTFTIMQASDVTWLWVQDVEVTSTSDYGQVSGPAGLIWYPAYKTAYGTFTIGSALTLSVPATVAGGTGERFACTGFTGTGSAPATGTANSVTFTAFAARNIVAWNWDHQYLLTVQTQGAGRVFGNFDWYNAGTDAVLTPVPDENSVFLRWEGALTDSQTSGRITMNSAKTVTAVFGAHRLWIVDPITGARALQGIYADGDTATARYPVPAHITTGSRFVTTGWQGTGSAPATGTGRLASFVMHADSEIRWTGVRQHFLGMRIRPADLGSISVTGTQTLVNTGWYDEGTLVIGATPAAGAHFLRWEGDLRGAPAPVDVSFTRPAEITALFRRDKTVSGFVPVIGGTLNSPNADTAGFTPDIANFDMKSKEVSVQEYVNYLNDALSYGAVTVAGNVAYGQPEVRPYAAGLYGIWTWTPSDGTGQQSVTGRTFGLAVDAAALSNPAKVLPTFTTGAVTSISGSFTGQIYVPALGTVSFKNEGAGTLTLKVDGATVLNNAATGTTASPSLAFGWHTAEIGWQATSTISMNLSWQLPGQASYTAVDTTMLRHEATTTTTSVELAGTWIGDDTQNDDTMEAPVTAASVMTDPAAGYNYVVAAMPKDFTFQGVVPLVSGGEAGLMVRERNDETAPYFFAGLNASGRLLCRYRNQAGGDEQTVSTGFIAQPGQLFRMQRVGNRVQAAIYRGSAWLDLLTESTEEEWLEVGDGQSVVMMAGFHSTSQAITFTGYEFWMPDFGNNFDGYRVMNLAAENCPVQWSGMAFSAKTGLDTYPATEMTWYGAKLYCKWMRETVQNSGYDLPSEWQVEYIAGNGDTTNPANLYPWQDGASSQASANLEGLETAGAYDGLAPVGSLAPVDGIYDLGGNAWEWTASLYWKNGVWRTIRGGSYLLPADYAATNYRFFYGYPFYGNKSVGFRPVCNQTPENVFVTIEAGQLVGPNSDIVSFASMIDGFKMQATEVTAKQYVVFLNWMLANGHATVLGQTVTGVGAEWADGRILLDLQDHPSVLYGGSAFTVRAGKGMRPIVQVSAYGADLYCTWLSLTSPAFAYRLPTEWEWEYAASYGQQLDLNWAAPSATGLTGFGEVLDVAASGPDTTFNAAGVAGLFDILGNVAEWTLSEPAFDTTRRMVRGGAYDMPEWMQTAYYRGTYRPLGYTAPDIGFRVISTALDAVPPEIETPPDVLLVLESETVVEDEGVVMGYVVRNGGTAGAVTVSLTSSMPGKLSVPATVNMGAGVGAVEFDCTLTDDLIAWGDVIVTVTAAVSGGGSATADILVKDNEKPEIFLVPGVASASEGAGHVTVTVNHNASTATARTIALTSSDPSRASVPASVTIPAGSSSTTFDATLVDDSLANETARIYLTAVAAGLDTGSASFEVLDNDIATLTVTCSSASMSEQGGSITGTVTRNTPTTATLTVALASSDTTEATVPATVTIAAGQTYATFAITAVDDAIADGTKPVTITGSTSGYVSGSVSVDVTDNETPTLTLSFAAGSIPENGGSTVATLTRNTELTPAITVTLSSNDTTEATVPATVAFAAGAVSATFLVTAADDSLADGEKTVTITASAAGFPDATKQLIVTDNETTVTFDAQGGTVPSPMSKIVSYGAAYGALASTTRTGYAFAGWWTGAGGTGTQITATSTVAITPLQTLYAKWTANSYTVTFDAQSGTAANPATTSVIYNSAYGALATTTRTGYAFVGWWTGVGGTGIQVNATDTVTITASQTLYAKWTANSYTVTFDAQSGTAANPTSKIVSYGAAYGPLATTTRTGYTFGGWWTSAGGTGTQITATTTVAITATQTLYAKWTANSYTVMFDAVGGTVTPASQGVTFDAAYGPLPPPTRTGYTFGGWWTGAGGAGTEVIATTTVTVTAAQTLYAKWTANSYTVTFDAAGGTVDPTSKTVTFDAAYGALATTARTGYAFAGWWTGAGGTGIQVTATTIITTATNHTLYAKWTYTVTFDAQGGTAPSPMSKIVTYGLTYGTLATTTRTGYTFAGWWTGAGGTGAEVMASTTATITVGHTLYAKWTANNYTVTFDAQGGSVTPTNKSVTYAAAYGPLPPPTRTGYTFAGWWTNAGGTGIQVTTDTVVSNAATHTLYAKWTANIYTVTFDAQGGTTANPTSKIVTYGSAYGALATTTRTGYTFGGWWTGAGGTGTEVIATTTVTVTAAQTLYAKWTANSYTVMFDAAGGTVTPTSTSVIFAATYGFLPTPTRTGYAFAGWWTGAGGAGTEVTTITTVTITAAQTLYAKWTANSYTVTFDAQSGSVTPTSTSVIFAAAYGPLPLPTRTGYTFGGWWTGAGGAGAEVTAMTTVAITAAQALYAKWTANSYTVTYDAAGGSVTPTSQIVTFGVAYGPLPSPTCIGYTFAGWWTGASGTGTQVTATTVVSTATDHAIHAKWMGNQTITFLALLPKTYGDADSAPGATASSGLATTYASSNTAVAAIVDGKIHIVSAGTTMITAAQSGNDNWNAASPVTQTLIVAKKTVTATAENQTRSFGAANPAFSIAYAGFVTGETAAVLDTPPTAVCSATATSGIGTYPITASGGSDSNYAFSYVAGTLTITPVVPTVTTTAPVAIGTTTATSGGNVTGVGGAAVTARGVCWSIAANPTVGNAKTTDGAGAGGFTSTLNKLSPSTTYYVRAYATNSAGTGYGAPQSFTTPVAKGADFVITGIVITPIMPAVGGKFTATITVKNQGLLSGKAGYLYVWLDKPGTAAVGEKGDKSASVSTLKPGASKTVKMSLTAPKTWGTFTLRAFIDAKNGVKEDDEYNNQETYVYDTGLPDFDILDVSLSPELPLAGKTFTAYVTVTNSGEVAGNAGYLDLWADSSALPATPVPGAKTKGNKYKTVGILQPGQEKVITVTGLKTPLGTAWTLGMLIDSRAKTVELDETNNWFEFDYGASATPPAPPPPPG